MQNAPTSKKTNLKNSELKKWLPAIMLAIILHLLVVIAFLVMQKDNSTKASPKAVSNTTMTQIGTEGVDNANASGSATEAMATITQASNAANAANGLANNPSALNPATAKQAGESHGATGTGATKQGTLSATTPSSTLEETAKDKQWLANRQGKALSSTTGTTSVAVNPINALNQAANANISNNMSDKMNNNVTPLTTGANTEVNGASNGQSSAVKPNRNPNQGLLLPRDAPKPSVDGSMTASDTKAQYATASQEIEAINDKLSQTINGVKERKMRQIQQDAMLEQAAHAKDQANKLQSQVTQVGQQLEVDRLAEKEFAAVKPVNTTANGNGNTKPTKSDKPYSDSP